MKEVKVIALCNHEVSLFVSEAQTAEIKRQEGALCLQCQTMEEKKQMMEMKKQAGDKIVNGLKIEGGIKKVTFSKEEAIAVIKDSFKHGNSEKIKDMIKYMYSALGWDKEERYQEFSSLALYRGELIGNSGVESRDPARIIAGYVTSKDAYGDFSSMVSWIAHFGNDIKNAEMQKEMAIGVQKEIIEKRKVI